MKKINYIQLILIAVLLVASCKQEPIVPTNPIAKPVPTPTKGTADFTKFVAVGDSYTAGFQGNALFNEGQANSMAKILATQFATVNAGAAFNQPDINSVNGTGRLVLVDPDGTNDPDGTGCKLSRSAGPKAAGTPQTTSTCPSAVTTAAMPAPYDLIDPASPATPYTGVKADLRNFGVPGTRIFHATVPNYGLGNPYFGRFATDATAVSLIADAAGKGGSFFMFYLGLFDILNYATAGGVGSNNGTTGIDLTPDAVFTGTYAPTLNALLAVPNSKGVAGNIPDITSIPFFFTVLWNAIEFKSTDCDVTATLAQLNGPTGFGGYNAALDFLATPAGGSTITQAEADKRKVSYKIGKNGILMTDETLADLTGALSAINVALTPYGKTRQAKATDLIPLTSGGILGTCQIPPGGMVPSPQYLAGVTAPVADQYVLHPVEITDILTRTASFNATIAAAVNASAGRVVLADINAAYKELVTKKAMVIDGVTISPSFAPPTGIFSEDGVHPNSRGYAFTANVFISVINDRFGATIPKASLASYTGTGLPINLPYIP